MSIWSDKAVSPRRHLSMVEWERQDPVSSGERDHGSNADVDNANIGTRFFGCLLEEWKEMLSKNKWADMAEGR